MRDSSIIRDEYNNKPEVINIDEYPVFEGMDYDLMDEKDFKKYMKDIEKCVRSSMEYRAMVNFIRENMNMDKCAFYENVTNKESFKIRIELHHHPFTLYDICYIVFKKRLSYHEDIDIEDISEEVMFIHYNTLVGLIPLSQTVHELVHNKYLFIPIDRVYGNWEDFYNMYFPFMEESMIELVKENIERSKNYVETPEELAILGKKYIYIDASELYTTPDASTIINNMNDRISDIRNERDNDNIKPNKKMIHYPNESNNSIF